MDLSSELSLNYNIYKKELVDIIGGGQVGEKGCAERKRGMVGSLVDLVGAVSWKVTGVFIIILIVVLVVVTIF